MYMYMQLLAFTMNDKEHTVKIISSDAAEVSVEESCVLFSLMKAALVSSFLPE